MVRSRTKLLDRVLAVILAVIMLLAMVPMSTLTALAASPVAGDNCQEATCGGKLQWVENTIPDGKHYLVCDNADCDYSNIANAYSSHNEGEGGTDCLLCNPPHAHGEFVYSLGNGNKTLVATCKSTGTCDLTDRKVSITIVAPTDLEYDNTVKSAIVDGVAAWKAATGNDVPEIIYNKEPKTVGSYTASITAEGKTASVGFEIVKGTPSYNVPTDLTAEYGQTLADVELPAGFVWNDATASVGEIGINTFKATFFPFDTTNYNVVSDIDITVTVGKAASIIAAPSISGEATHTSITVNEIIPTVGDGTVEYGYIKNEVDKNDPSKVTNWQTGTTFDRLEGSTTYYFYARVSETTNYAAAVSHMSSISTKDKLNGELSISISDWTYGETAVNPDFDIITGDYVLSKIEYAIKGETNWSEDVPSNAGEYTVRIYCGATAVYAEAVKSCDFEIKQKEVSVEWSNTTLIYNAQEQNPTAVITDGIAESDDVAVVVSGAQKDAGDNYSAEATLIGSKAVNYVIKANKTQLFNIDEKEVVITWANTSLTHNKDRQKPTATINEGEIFAEDVVNVKVSGAEKRPGTYTATATLTGVDAANYVINGTLSSTQFVISNLETPADPFTIVKAIDGTTIANANENHWYNYDIKIIPKEGYTIGTADDGDSNFSSALTITESKQDYKVFLRDALGRYTGEISIGDTFGNVDGNINIDKDLPKAFTKINEGSLWDIFLETVTFGIYHKDEVTVTLSGTDENSTIDHVYYYKLEKNRLSNSDLFEKGEDIPSWNKGTTVTINKDSDYVVYAKVIDKAGNVSYASTKDFVFDATRPVIEVSFDNNDVANGKYFKAKREATIQITEHNFDENGVVLNITEGGVDTSSNYALNWNTDGDVHTAKVLFTNEADYTFAISAKDKAGNDNKPVVYVKGSVATNEFTIDKSKPDAELVIEGLVKDATSSWKESWKTEHDDVNDQNDRVSDVLTSIDYNNRWSNSNAKVSATSTDNLSGVDYIEYFRTENVVTDITANNIIWSNSTKDLTIKDAFNFEVEPNEKFIVYVHIIDKAGNDIYLSSNGVIVDDKAPGGDNYSPEIDITLPKANYNGIYNEDDTVKVDFKVVEPKYSGANIQTNTGIYSGIKEIKYVIKAEDINVVEEQTFDLTSGSMKDTNGLISSWIGSITIDKEKFNSNNVVVMITAIDNAGNVHTSTTKIGDIKIDMTTPVIDIEYDNNAADSTSFFKEKRIAKVVITERNFEDNDDIVVTITNTDGIIPSISAFSKVEGTDGGNGDNTQWEATIVYEADGDYTFAIEYTDLADNVCEDINYAAGTVAATEFTVDRTLPTISVTYDNNSALNGKYFAKNRTATVVINEHNFDVTRVDFSAMGGTLEGDRLDRQPDINWNHEGDIHTATIPFKVDGDYTFDVKMTDKAGNESKDANYGNTVAGKDFVVDQNIEKPTIGGVADGYAYKGDVIPTISFNDVNYDSYEVKLVRTRMGEKNVDVTDEFIKGVTEETQGGSGTYDTFKKVVENDGIYTLTVKMIDKAGNEETEEYTFTVNRFGSVYEYSDYLISLLEKQYIKIDGNNSEAVTQDLVITEYNANQILTDSLNILITRDGETINAKYTSNPTVDNNASIGDSGWYQYAYTIAKENFEEDGVYKITLTSAYAANDSERNESTSVPENSIDAAGNQILNTMNFTVDTTKPEIRNIVNLDKQIVNAQTLDIDYTIVDVGGLKSIEIIVNGSTIDTITEFGDNSFNYSGSFTLNESSDAQTAQLKVTDMAGNVTDTAADDFSTNDLYVFNDTITVSTNFFVRWYANKPLFWGSIGGVVVLVGAIWFLIAFKRRKKDAQKTK